MSKQRQQQPIDLVQISLYLQILEVYINAIYLIKHWKTKTDTCIKQTLTNNNMNEKTS